MASGEESLELPPELLQKLRDLELELEDGDITEKGYEKKKATLLQQYHATQVTATSTPLQSVDKDDHDEANENNDLDSQALQVDLDPEPSAADVVDFLDYLPSPTHSPTQREESQALAFMEENHNRLQQGQQESTNSTNPPLPGETPLPSATQPIPQQRPMHYAPVQTTPHPQGPQQTGPMGPIPLGTNNAFQHSGPVMGSRPNWPPDPRSMPRGPYQQIAPMQGVRPPGMPNVYSVHGNQQRPYGAMPYRPNPVAGQPFPPRPGYMPHQRPLPSAQPVPANMRPMYRPAPGMPLPRPGPRPPVSSHMQPVASPRPYNNQIPWHGQPPSLEPRSDTNSVIQPSPVKADPGLADGQGKGFGRPDDWETGSVSGNPAWRSSGGKAPSIMSATTRVSGHRLTLTDYDRIPAVRRLMGGRMLGKYGDCYMASSFKAVDPAPQMRLMMDDPMGQMLLADLAGRQLLPLHPREIPFDTVDTSDQKNMDEFVNLAEILRYRATRSAGARSAAFTVVDNRGKESATINWEKLNARAEKVAHMIREKSGLQTGERVALVYRKAEQIEFIVALLGCFLAGMVAVPINAAEELAELSFILNVTNAYLILTTEINLRTFTKDLQSRSIEFPPNIDWWKTDDFGSWYPRAKTNGYPAISTPELAYIEYTKAANGELKGIAMNHRTIMAECKALTASLTKTSVSVGEDNSMAVEPDRRERQPERIVSYLEQRQQMGLIMSVLLPIFTGSETIFASSSIVDTPAVWIYVLSKYKATIALADYSSMKYAAKYYQSHTKEVQNQSKKVQPDLSSLRHLLLDTVVVKPAVNEFIAKELLQPLGNVDPFKTVCPVVTLAEHGGVTLALKDGLGPAQLEEIAMADTGNPEPKIVLATGQSWDTWEYLLDAESLKTGKVVVVAAGKQDGESALEQSPGLVRVGSFGFVVAEGVVAIVDPDTGTLCPPDRIGEVWIDAPSLPGGFWALPQHTEAICHARPVVVQSDTLYPEIYDQEFLRTGLAGTVIGGRLVMFGTYEECVRQQRLGASNGVEEVHFASGITETVNTLASSCVVFDITLSEQHVVVVACESSLAQAELPKLADNITDALDQHHGIRPYAVFIMENGTLPRYVTHGRRRVHPLMTKRAFLTGQINMRYLKMDTAKTIANIPTGEDALQNIWTSDYAYDRAIRSGVIFPRPQQQHTGMEAVRQIIDERSDYDLSQFGNIVDILLWRTKLYPEEVAFVSVLQASSGGTINTKPYTWRKINNKIATAAHHLMRKGFKPGRKALVLVPFGIEWIIAIYACFVLGVAPVPFQPPDYQQHPQRVKEDVTSLVTTIKDLEIAYILVNPQSEDIMKNKHVAPVTRQVLAQPGGKAFKLPEFTNIAKASKTSKMLGKESGLWVRPEWSGAPNHFPALLTVNCSASGQRSYGVVSHENILAQCRTQKTTCQLKPQRTFVGTGLGAFNGLGLLHSAFCGVYVGAPTVLLPLTEFYTSPATFFELLQRYKAKDVCASPLVLQYAMNRITPVEHRRLLLQTLQNMMVVTEGRPKPVLYQHMVKYFAPNRLDKVAINTVYSHASNPMVTTRSYMLLEPITILVDVAWLRQGIVRSLPYENEANGVYLHDSGIVPSNTMVAIVNPETRTVVPSHMIGEIWVASDCNVKGLPGTKDEQNTEHVIAGADPRVKYLRTGDIGFLWNVQRRVDDPSQPLVEEGQCLFVLGSMDEVIHYKGLMHFAGDIEATVERCHPQVTAGGSIVFQTPTEIVVIAAVKTNDQVMGAVPVIVGSILNSHGILVDTVVMVNHSQLPRNRYGDKQRLNAITAYTDKTMSVIYMKRLTNPDEESLPQWVSQPNNDDTVSVVSARSGYQSTSARSIHEDANITRNSSFHTELNSDDPPQTSRQSIHWQSSAPSSPAVTHASYTEQSAPV